VVFDYWGFGENKDMRSEEEIQKALSVAITNCVRADTIEGLRFAQGQINIIEWMLGQEQNAFSEEEIKPEEKKE
jgi:hypothetical protein